MFKMRLWMILGLLVSQISLSNEITIISQNIGGSFFKKQKKGLNNIVRTISYYQADIHLFQNTFHPYSDTLKHSNIHQYFSYDEAVKKRTSSIETTDYPIVDESFLPFSHCFSYWKNFGIKRVSILINEKELDLYNASFPKNKKFAWKNALSIEKFIKRQSKNEDFILAIAFNQLKNRKEIISYLEKKLGVKEIPSNKSLNIEKVGQKRGGNNVLLIRSGAHHYNLIESYPIFDGTHDENRYLKNNGYLYRLSY